MPSSTARRVSKVLQGKSEEALREQYLSRAQLKCSTRQRVSQINAKSTFDACFDAAFQRLEPMLDVHGGKQLLPRTGDTYYYPWLVGVFAEVLESGLRGKSDNALAAIIYLHNPDPDPDEES